MGSIDLEADAYDPTVLALFKEGSTRDDDMIGLAGKRIDLDMTPQEAMRTIHLSNQEDYGRLQREIAADRLQEEIAAKADVAFPFVDVRNFQAALAWMIYDEHGSISGMERVSKEEQLQLGISDQMLLDAIYATCGAINHNGLYPISDEIKTKLEVLK